MSAPAAATSAAPAARPRAAWRAVAVPSEHGGWGLTLEPVLLGLIVAGSWAGVALGVAAVGAFVVRTPLKLALVDARRERSLARTRLARRIAAAELAVMAALAALAGARAGWSWLVPVAAALPLVAVELWFDAHSRGRRLVPELCGSVGIAAVAAVVVLAGGGSVRLAVGCWLVLAARSLGAIPFVRARIRRLRRGETVVDDVDLAQVVSVGVGVVAAVVDRRLVVGLAGLAALAIAQALGARRPPVPPKVLGMRQMAVGVGLAVATGIGVLAG